ncbi:MAG: YARHG domain-containing protein [Elusimicrobiota bacterium]|nr:YARHG domain-containing protein [Elusimicrobiota bacterium]
MSTQKIEAKDLEHKSPSELHVLRNLIFAHHCYAFKSPYLREIAKYQLRDDNDLGIYQPKTTDVVLTEIENSNVELLKKYEALARKRVEVAAPIVSAGFEASLREGVETCFKAELEKGKKRLVCVYLHPTQFEGSINLLAVDWSYSGAGMDAAMPVIPSSVKLVDIDPRDAFQEVELEGLTSYRLVAGTFRRMDDIREDERAKKQVTLGAEDQAPAETLKAFFKLLHTKQYSEAAALYGGSYETLFDWNPVVRRTDTAQLWKNACEQNGLQCYPIHKILSVSSAPNRWEFEVQYTRDGTSPMMLCRDMSSYEHDSAMQVAVERKDGKYLVMGGPSYCP